MQPTVPTIPPEHIAAGILGALLAVAAVAAGAMFPSLWWLDDDAIAAAEFEAACVRRLAPQDAGELEVARRECRARYRAAR